MKRRIPKMTLRPREGELRRLLQHAKFLKMWGLDKPAARKTAIIKSEHKRLRVEPSDRLYTFSSLKKFASLKLQRLRYLNKLRKDRDPVNRVYAIQELTKYNTPRVVNALANSLNDKDLRVRECAADGLATLAKNIKNERLRKTVKNFIVKAINKETEPVVKKLLELILKELEGI